VGVLAWPGNAALAARCIGRTIDALWHAAGDRAADFSWYTKRATLAGVYAATPLPRRCCSGCAMIVRTILRLWRSWIAVCKTLAASAACAARPRRSCAASAPAAICPGTARSRRQIRDFSIERGAAALGAVQPVMSWLTLLAAALAASLGVLCLARTCWIIVGTIRFQICAPCGTSGTFTAYGNILNTRSLNG
jgi:hypothetical protein